MPQPPGNKSDVPSTDFGANEWLVEEMYDQYQRDPDSVDPTWVKYFQQNGDRWQINKQIRDMVQYRPFNLLQPMAPLGRFDVVFCRNVLIYFDQPTKTKVLDGIAGQMADDGFLYLGGAETILGVSERFQLIEGQRGIYGVQAGTAKPGLKAAAG